SPIHGRAPSQPYFRGLCCWRILVFHFLSPYHSCLFFVLQSFSSALSSRSFVGRAHIGKLGDQIGVGSYFILGNLPICEDGQEGIEDILGECPAINGKGRRARRVIGQKIWQQCASHPFCFLRRITTCVLKRVRENGQETRVVGRRTSEVRIFFLARKDVRLGRQRAAVHLTPAAAPAALGNQGAGPQANLLRPQGRVGHFKSDAAHVFVSEEIVAGELQIVLCAFHVAEEWIAAPAGKEPVIARLRHP